ncbi:carbon-phosphorus lyase, partial [Bradyrhizobium sp. 23]|nr:carbon-phosphorus lyase [Bradyrhizobium sp. 23]
GRMFVCSDTDYCEGRQAAGHHGSLSAAPYKDKAQEASNG